MLGLINIVAPIVVQHGCQVGVQDNHDKPGQPNPNIVSRQALFGVVRIDITPCEVINSVP